jgi:hypothetical protein
MERRLRALEDQQEAASTADDGYAPDAWTRLAPWALMVHDVGGWEAACAAAHVRTLPEASNPYAGKSGGPLWDVTVYWQRGDTRRSLNRTDEQFALQVIAACVTHLLDQGMSRAEVREWRTGRMIWDAVWDACTVGEQS